MKKKYESSPEAFMDNAFYKINKIIKRSCEENNEDVIIRICTTAVFEERKNSFAVSLLCIYSSRWLRVSRWMRLQHAVVHILQGNDRVVTRVFITEEVKDDRHTVTPESSVSTRNSRRPRDGHRLVRGKLHLCEWASHQNLWDGKKRLIAIQWNLDNFKIE